MLDGSDLRHTHYKRRIHLDHLTSHDPCQTFQQQIKSFRRCLSGLATMTLWSALISHEWDWLAMIDMFPPIKKTVVSSRINRSQSSHFLEEWDQILRAPSFIPIYVFPIIVIRGRRPCVGHNWFQRLSASINHEDSFHTVHTRSTAKSPSGNGVQWAITQSWSRFCCMKWKCFCWKKERTSIAPRLYMIWYITGMRTSFHDLSVLVELERYWWTKRSLKLTRIFKEGSASARRPAVMQATAPPNLNISTTAIWIGKEESYPLQRWYHKLYYISRPLWVPNWREWKDGEYLLTLGRAIDMKRRVIRFGIIVLDWSTWERCNLRSDETPFRNQRNC